MPYQATVMRIVEGLRGKVHARGSTLLKVIDEYNYAKFANGWGDKGDALEMLTCYGKSCPRQSSGRLTAAADFRATT